VQVLATFSCQEGCTELLKLRETLCSGSTEKPLTPQSWLLPNGMGRMCQMLVVIGDGLVENPEVVVPLPAQQSAHAGRARTGTPSKATSL
jgi:hypothetical protein